MIRKQMNKVSKKDVEIDWHDLKTKLNVEDKGVQNGFELSGLLYLDENDCH